MYWDETLAESRDALPRLGSRRGPNHLAKSSARGARALRDGLSVRARSLRTDALKATALASSERHRVIATAHAPPQRPDVATVLPLPASTGMVSSADGLFGRGDLDKQIHTTGLNEFSAASRRERFRTGKAS